MFDVRERLLFEISRRLIKPPSAHTSNYDAYDAWRSSELRSQWDHFSARDVTAKDVLDFGCGFGGLSFHLLQFGPKSIYGVDLAPEAITRCEETLRTIRSAEASRARFAVGSPSRIPADDASFDTILAFDCLEHIMELDTILVEWRRVLRPGGKVLIWWSPFRGPYGPHMEAIVPIPWAHVFFGERAMLRTAERIYDLDSFVPRPWNLDENGHKKPNTWKAYATFKDWNYINQLTESEFLEAAERAGLAVPRLEPHSFKSSRTKRLVGSALVKVPVLREYMTSYYIIECQRPER